MKKQFVLVAMIAAGLAAAPVAFAQDTMKPGMTKSDGMKDGKKDKMKSGAMSDKKPDGMMKSDGMTKPDAMKKDGMSK